MPVMKIVIPLSPTFGPAERHNYFFLNTVDGNEATEVLENVSVWAVTLSETI